MKRSLCMVIGSVALLSTVLTGCSGLFGEKEHTFGDWVVVTEATCTEEGSKKHICTGCGFEETDVIGAKGHSYDEGKITTAASCTEKGTKTFTCSVCSSVKTEDIKASGHTFGDGEITKAASCTEKGTMTYKCSVCDGTKTEDIAAKGHSYDKGVITKIAGCIEKGCRTYTCTACNETKEEEIAATGHSSSKIKCSTCGTFFITVNPVGTAVKDSKGLDVTILEWTKTVGENYDTYSLRYKVANNVADSKLTPGTFEIIMEDGSTESQYGFFNDIYSGDSTTRSYSWKILHTQKPLVLKYEDVFASFGGTKETPLYWDIPE